MSRLRALQLVITIAITFALAPVAALTSSLGRDIYLAVIPEDMRTRTPKHSELHE